MNATEVKPGIYWVGGIDWNLRNFHGYKTQRGTTYNAYLIVDERVTLVDTVKHYLFDEMMARIRSVIDPQRIDLVVSNHVEMDHSGCLKKLSGLLGGVEIITSPSGEKELPEHFGKGLDLTAVETGQSVSLGERTLRFVCAPMVHWPDSMETYCPEEKMLFSNDGFGQHIASSERFTDQLGFDIVMEEAAKYYANIVLPYGAQVQKLLDVASELEIETIATGHGLIWRCAEQIGKIVDAYRRWATNETVPKAVIMFDTMWGSTKTLAEALRDGLEDEGVPVFMGWLDTNHVSDIMTQMLEARGVLVGSPTLNSHVFPSVAGAMTYVAGLRPIKRLGLVFGSYGWGRQAISGLKTFMDELGWGQPFEPVAVQWVPDKEDLKSARAAGREFAKAIKEG